MAIDLRIENDNRVLIAGGRTTFEPDAADSGVEIYDPAQGDWGTVLSGSWDLAAARWGHSCTKLSSGEVLVAYYHVRLFGYVKESIRLRVTRHDIPLTPLEPSSERQS